MDVLESYKLQVSFDTVRYMLEKKQYPLNENGKANLQRSISFLDGVMQSIDSLGISKNEEKAYYFTPKLRDIIGIKYNKPNISKDDIN
jgi:phage gp36-like protein